LMHLRKAHSDDVIISQKKKVVWLFLGAGFVSWARKCSPIRALASRCKRRICATIAENRIYKWCGDKNKGGGGGRRRSKRN
jgi:hypothetical protein